VWLPSADWTSKCSSHAHRGLLYPEGPTLHHMEKSFALFVLMTKSETSWKRCWKMSGFYNCDLCVYTCDNDCLGDPQCIGVKIAAHDGCGQGSVVSHSVIFLYQLSCVWSWQTFKPTEPLQWHQSHSHNQDGYHKPLILFFWVRHSLLAFSFEAEVTNSLLVYCCRQVAKVRGRFASKSAPNSITLNNVTVVLNVTAVC